MKYKMVWLCISLMGAVSVMSAPGAPQLRIPTLPSIAFKQLKSRLELFPELYELFVELHSPAVRLQRRLYGRKRVEFDQALKLYELSSTLVRDLKRFNKKMKPRVPKPWWKRTEVVAPVVLGALTAAGVGGAVWKRHETKKKAAAAQQLALTPSRDRTLLGSIGEGEHFHAPGVEAGFTPLGSDTSGVPTGGADLGRIDDSFAGLEGPPVVPVVTGPGQAAAGVVGGGQADGRLTGGFDPKALMTADDLEVGGPAGAGAGAGAGSETVVAGGAAVRSTALTVPEIVITGAAIDDQLAALQKEARGETVHGHQLYSDVPFFMAFVKPNNWQPYAHSAVPTARGYKKSFLYDQNPSLKNSVLVAKIPEIVAGLAAANAALVGQISESGTTHIDVDDVRVQTLIDRFLIITHCCMFLEQTKTGRVLIRSNILVQQNLVDMAKAGNLKQACTKSGTVLNDVLLCNFIINSFSVRAGLQEHIISAIQSGVNRLKGAKSGDWTLAALVRGVQGVLWMFLNGDADMRTRNELEAISKERGKLTGEDQKHQRIQESYNALRSS